VPMILSFFSYLEALFEGFLILDFLAILYRIFIYKRTSSYFIPQEEVF
jgi:hypothetical protein